MLQMVTMARVAVTMATEVVEMVTAVPTEAHLGVTMGVMGRMGIVMDRTVQLSLLQEPMGRATLALVR